MAGPLAPKLALARAVGAISRLRGGGASSAPGKVLMRLDPGAIGELGARLPRGSVLVSATNGKTTTSAILAGIFEHANVSLVNNQTGANMAGGIASTLLLAARSRGGISGELGLFEVDELWLDSLAAQLHPRAILLGNLFRDQLDRYGELETIADRWAAAVHTGPARESLLVLNADDPAIADLGRERDAPVLYFGVEDDSLALPGMAHAADAKHCRRCGAPYVFEAVYLGHLGHYHCPSCGQTRPTPSVIAKRVTLEGVHAAHFTLQTPAGEAEVRLSLPGLYNVYNALAAAALATALEVGLPEIVAGLQGTKAAFGRAETVTLALDPKPGRDAQGAVAGTAAPAQRELQILLVKNPAGANEVLRTLALEPGEHDLLGVLNDKIADGRDVSWIWDADFELLAGRVRLVTCSGTRAPELALRLKYAGIDPARIRVQDDLPRALREAASDRRDPQAPLYALPTYTAMLALRELLVARGEARSAWS
ncbi:MAG TPA: MurT ligase domain-containing protein [Solirubrobacteraceae bacterium]|nr:MurT ligase domain-containing protein [Solirubrobacteraceae bacterium]